MNKPATTSPKPLGRAELRSFRDQLLAVPPNRRVPMLIERPDLRQVLRRLSPQDLLIALYAHGMGDSLELIELMPAAQVQAFIDMEGWQRDRIDSRALASWLSVLYAANPQGALAQVMGLDAELVTLFLKLHTRVYDLGQEESPESTPMSSLTTPDNCYLITFVSPPHPKGREQADATDAMGTEVALQIVKGLIARQPFMASRYLASVRWELPSELEEACLRWRNGRLADHGYPELYEALAIYAPIDLNKPPRVPAADVVPDPDDVDGALTLFVDEAAGAALLRQALQCLGPRDADRCRRQMAALANRVASAQLLSPGNIEALTAAAHDAMATSNLGLEWLSKGDVDRAAQMLREMALQDIFRCGHTLVDQLARRARRVRNRLRIDADHHLLPPLSDKIVAALCARPPRMHQALMDPGLDAQSPFETLAQLARAAEHIADQAFSAAWLLDVLGFDIDHCEALIEQAGSPVAVDILHLDSLLATAICRQKLTGTLSFEPLDASDLDRLWREGRGDFTAWLSPCRDPVLASIEARLPLPGATGLDVAKERLQRRLDALAAELDQELAGLDEAPDPRHVTSVLTLVSEA